MMWFRPLAKPALACAAVLWFAAPGAWAQQAGSQWGLGVGVGVERQPYRDYDNKLRGLPILLYSNQYVSVIGPGVDVHLPSAGPVELRLRARYARDGYEEEDSPFLAGMAERKDSIWVGGAALWRTDFASLSAEILGDASGKSKGTKFKLQVDRRFAAGAFGLTPRLAALRS